MDEALQDQQIVAPTFNGWAVYGVAWSMASVRVLHLQLLSREAEIARLRNELAQWQDRTLMRQSITPLTPGMQERAASSSGISVQRQQRAPISSHIADARKKEELAYWGALTRTADEENKRARIKADGNGKHE